MHLTELNLRGIILDLHIALFLLFDPVKVPLTFSGLPMFYWQLHFHEHTFRFIELSLEVAYPGNFTSA